MTTIEELEAQHRAAVAELDAAQRSLSSTPRSDPEARRAASHAVEAAHERIRAAKDLIKQENARRNFAGIGSPLHEVLVARLDPATVAVLEADAMARLAERERKSAERRTLKAAAATAAAPAPAPAAVPAPASGVRVQPLSPRPPAPVLHDDGPPVEVYVRRAPRAACGGAR